MLLSVPRIRKGRRAAADPLDFLLSSLVLQNILPTSQHKIHQETNGHQNFIYYIAQYTQLVEHMKFFDHVFNIHVTIVNKVFHRNKLAIEKLFLQV